MKKLLSLVLCFCMALTICLAHAELQVPQLKPTQEEFQMGFLGKLIGFLPNLNLDGNALHIEASQADQALLDALLQQAEGIVDFNGTVAGTPVRAQLTEDAILLSYDGQVFKLPFETLLSMVQQNGVAAVNPSALLEPINAFIESAIIPSVTVEESESGRHIVVDITQEKLAGGLAELGDAFAENPQFIQLLSAFGISDFDALWPEIREMIANGLLQLSLHADALIGETGGTLDAEGVFFGAPYTLTGSTEGAVTAFRFDVADALTLSGSTDETTGAYEYHGAGIAGCAFDAVFRPSDEGWTYAFTLAAEDTTLVSCEAALTGEAFDGSLMCNAEGEAVTITARLDLTTLALSAKLTLPESMGGIVADITGETTATGYHVGIDVNMYGMKLGTVDIFYTDTDELAGLEATVTTTQLGEDLTTLMSASFAYAKDSGAYALRYEDVDGNYCDGDGVLTETRQTGTLTVGRQDRELKRIEFERRSDAQAYVYRYAEYEDMRYRGTLDIKTDLSFELDRETGAFRGSLQQTGERMKLDIRGICAPGILSFRFDSASYGRISGILEVDAQWDENGTTAAYTYTDGYDVWSGNLLWTSAVKKLSVNGDYQRYLFSLEQDGDGAPRALRIIFPAGDRYSATEISVDGRGINVNTDGTGLAISGRFLDESTYRVDAVTSNYGMTENVVHVDIAVKDRTIEIVAVDDYGAALFEGGITATDPADFEPLDESEGIVELTSEFITALLSGAEESAYPEEDDFSEDYAEAYEDEATESETAEEAVSA